MNAQQENNVNYNGTLPAARVAVEGTISNQLNTVKHQIFREFQGELGPNDQLLRLALIEADALARQTEYPELIFPLLAAEKAEKAARWQFRQQFLLRSNYALAA